MRKKYNTPHRRRVRSLRGRRTVRERELPRLPNLAKGHLSFLGIRHKAASARLPRQRAVRSSLLLLRRHGLSYDGQISPRHRPSRTASGGSRSGSEANRSRSLRRRPAGHDGTGTPLRKLPLPPAKAGQRRARHHAPPQRESLIFAPKPRR